MKQIAKLLLLLPLSACATLTADSQQVVTLDTTPQGAVCEVTSSEGTLTSDPTPSTVTVKRAFEPLLIHCTQGDLRGDATAEPGTRGRAYGNILLGGVPAIVDAGNGKGYEYPKLVTIPLSKEGSHLTVKP